MNEEIKQLEGKSVTVIDNNTTNYLLKITGVFTTCNDLIRIVGKKNKNNLTFIKYFIAIIKESEVPMFKGHEDMPQSFRVTFKNETYIDIIINE